MGLAQAEALSYGVSEGSANATENHGLRRFRVVAREAADRLASRAGAGLLGVDVREKDRTAGLVPAGPPRATKSVASGVRAR